MQILNATDARKRLGRLIDEAQREPVAIERNGRVVAYVLSPDQFQALQAARRQHADAIAEGWNAVEQRVGSFADTHAPGFLSSQETGKGLWGDDPADYIAKLRDEF
jgi:prevent-host-death family protein